MEPVKHQVSDINRAMCAVGKADIGGFRTVCAMAGRPEQAVNGETPRFPGFQHKTPWRRKFMEIGIAAQIDGVAADGLVDGPRQRRIDDPEILHRLAGKIEQGEGEATRCGIFERMP